jgi:triacylglycerol lipase
MGAFSKHEFKPTHNFDARIAYACGVAADFAYFDKDDCRVGLEREGFAIEHFRFFDDPNTDTQAFVAADDEKIIVSFRGTESDPDKLTDLNLILQQTGHGGSVHYGFYQALLSIWDSGLADTINDFGARAGKYVYFTGHSLGAAITTIAAFHFVNEQGKTPHVYTFGSPRVGDDAFGSAYDRVLKRTTFRYVNDMDIVVYMPPEKLGYTHVGHPVYFDDGGGVSTRVSYFERLATRALQLFERDIVGIDSEWFNDHNIKHEYVPNLRRHIDTRLSFN